MYSLSVSIVCNPFIYAIVDREFIGYIKELFLLLLYKLLLCVDWCWTKVYGAEGYESEYSSMYSFELMQRGQARGNQYQYRLPSRRTA